MFHRACTIAAGQDEAAENFAHEIKGYFDLVKRERIVPTSQRPQETSRASPDG